MAVIKKMMLRSVAALVIGALVVGAVVLLLSSYGGQDTIATIAAQPMPFPENEQDLDAIAAKLARQGEALSGIEPAAGE